MAKTSGKSKTTAPVSDIKETIVVQSSIPNIRQLFTASSQTIWNNRWLFARLAVVYGLFSFLFQGQGLFSVNNLSGITKGSISAALSSLGGGTGAATAAAGSTLQFLLILITSLALIWVLRQLHAGHDVGAKEAYYKSGAALVPLILVLAVVALQLLPLIIGAGIYATLIGYNILNSGIEQIIAGLICALLAWPSLYWTTSSFFAAYIVTLPDSTPLVALRSARELVYKRRLKIFTRVIMAPIALFAATFLLLAPFILIVPVLTQAAYFVIASLTLVFLHTYMYTLYWGLLDE
ncbi:MAG: conserved rane protein of unknown function [Candidatus Saccharibacteria bacterium]|nr:conserved rane protein of unknown function [Candidatus Saccharibacteria bacterium]